MAQGQPQPAASAHVQTTAQTQRTPNTPRSILVRTSEPRKQPAFPGMDRGVNASAPSSFVATLPADLGARQRTLQQQRSGYLQEALFAHFCVVPNTPPTNPLTYQIKFPQRTDLPIIPAFKPYGLASSTSVAELVVAEWKAARQNADSQVVTGEEMIQGMADTGALGIAMDAVRSGLECLEDDHRYKQGGVLYLLGSVDLFWTAMIVWHLLGTTGHNAWDDEFSRLTLFPNQPQYTPCMFFQTPYGCQDRICSLSHMAPNALRRASLFVPSAQSKASKRRSGVIPRSPNMARNRRFLSATEQSIAPYRPDMKNASAVLPPLRKVAPGDKSSSGDEATSPITTVGTTGPFFAPYYQSNKSSPAVLVPSDRANPSISTDDSDMNAAHGTKKSSSVMTPAPIVTLASNKSLQNLRESLQTPVSASTPISFLDMHYNAQAGVQRPVATCANCRKLEPDGVKFKMCSRCRIDRYCGKACQEEHWQKGHSRLCIAKSPSAARRPS
ncbi:hypothetical protein BJ742DRAFT_743178 [Cladochytrium replicatum]|nr:hypothetical protein BJ742DRAFT_743178 [Cladochytrium replicatum]